MASPRTTEAMAAGVARGRRHVLDGTVTDGQPDRTVTAGREIAADAAAVFELIADPARQPAWDGNDNLAHAPASASAPSVTSSR